MSGMPRHPDRLFARAKRSETGVVFGIDSPFSIKTTKPERPGKFYFPPMAALITSAARLMLGLF